MVPYWVRSNPLSGEPIPPLTPPILPCEGLGEGFEAAGGRLRGPGRGARRGAAGHGLCTGALNNPSIDPLTCPT